MPIQMYNAPEGQTSSQPDLRDPFNTGMQLPSGPQVIEALGRAGYNVNDPYGLSKMFDIAQQGTNLLDSVYKENIAATQAVADYNYKVAQAKQVDAEANYRNASSDAQIADIKSQTTLRNAQANEVGQRVLINNQNAAALQKERTLKFGLDQYNAKLYQDGMNDAVGAQDEIADLRNHVNDPDFEQRVLEFYNKHPNIGRDPTGTAPRYIQGEIDQMRAHKNNDLQANELARQRAVIGQLLGKGALQYSPDMDSRILRGEGPAMIRQGNTSDAINRLQAIQGAAQRLPETNLDRQRILNESANEIRDIQSWQNPQDPRNPANGQLSGERNVVPPMTDIQGNLNANTEALIEGLEVRSGLRAPAAPAAAAAPVGETTQKYDEQGRPKETTYKYPGAPQLQQQPAQAGQPAQGQQSWQQQREAMKNDPDWQGLLQTAHANPQSVGIPAGVDVDSEQGVQILAQRYAAIKQAKGQPVQGNVQEGQPAQPGQTPAPQPAQPGQAPAVPAGTPAVSRADAEAEADRRLGPLRAADARAAETKTRAGQKPARVEDQALQERERIIQGLMAPKPAAAPKGRKGASAAPASTAGMSDDEVAQAATAAGTDPVYQQLLADTDENPLPGGADVNTPEGQRALLDRYFQERAQTTYGGPQIGPAQAQPVAMQLPDRTPARPDQAVPREVAYQTQNQSAAAPVLVANNPATVDYHTFKFGNSTTFGLNYDGTRDFGDDGEGFYRNPASGRPYNTRDPTLVGAKIPAADLVSYFGPEAARPDSGISQLVSRGDVQIQVASPEGGVVQMPLVDQGSGRRAGATLDLTMAASRLFNTQGNRVLGYRFVDRYGNPFTLARA